MEIYHYWIIIGILLMIAEIFTPGFLLASFGIGAYGASIAAYWGYEFKFQLLAFSIVTSAIFFAIRPLYFKFLHRFDDKRETGVKAFIGKAYKVTESINNTENTGRVTIGSESWRARSETDELVEAGELIKVIRIEGSTLMISSMNKIGA